jgi:hypothetical protein
LSGYWLGVYGGCLWWVLALGIKFMGVYTYMISVDITSERMESRPKLTKNQEVSREMELKLAPDLQIQ